MTEITIYNWAQAVEWCEKNIGPREFWLHNSIGGLGWSLTQKYRLGHEHSLIIEDDKKALIAILSLK